MSVINRIIAVDPGSTNGYAMLRIADSKVVATTIENITYDKFLDKLTKLAEAIRAGKMTNPPHFVCEQFRIREEAANKFIWNEMQVIRAIGAFEVAARMLECPFTFQEPTALRMGARYSGIAQPTNHAISHKVDALNHAYFYGVTKGLIRFERKIYDGFN